jgi:hypothetical protein
MKKYFAALFGFFLVAAPALAQETTLINPLGGTSSNPGGTTSSLPQLIGVFIKFIVGFVGTLALLMFVWGGLQFILARGDAKKVGSGKQTMIWAVYGLVIIFFAYAIVSAITGALGQAGAA